jgi:hypothetical protein
MKASAVRASALAITLASGAVGALSGCHKSSPPPAPAPPETGPEWTLLASELPSALLSVTGRSATDIYAVGADKGHGPLILHFDGKKWAELHSGTSGDLWWADALPKGPLLLGGSHGTVLRFDGQRFERMKTPGLPEQTVYGVWGTDAGDFYAVGNAAGKNGFVWHFRGGGENPGAFEKEALPADLPRMAGGDLPGFFKVFGIGDEVWVVGAAGVILHRAGAGPFALVPSTTKDTLFTVHGTRDHLVAVGGSGNGVLLDGRSGAFHDASPVAAGLLQGVFTTDRGDWATGERGSIYSRAAGATAFGPVDHGLTLPTTSALHSVFVDSSGGVWSAGGNVLNTALNDGVLVHFGAPVPTVVIEDEDGGAP